MSEFGIDLASPGGWLPLVFALVMALSMLAYVILDGYDLGVGALLNSADTIEHKNTMIASIGPFWDANETWLVLGIGILLTIFPLAHGVILGALYLPVAFMLRMPSVIVALQPRSFQPASGSTLLEGAWAATGL